MLVEGMRAVKVGWRAEITSIFAFFANLKILPAATSGAVSGNCKQIHIQLLKEQERSQSHTSPGTRLASQSNQLVSIIPKEGEL